MEIPSALVAFAVIMGIAYWVNSSREEKERATANEEATKAAQAKRDSRENARNKARDAISSRAAEFKVEYPSDQMDWILDSAEARSGEKGLSNIAHVFKTAPSDTIEKLITKIEKDHLMYTVDLRLEQELVEAERRWKTVLDDFKRLNHAQQKVHLAYIKKNTDELTEEQLHILELISLGEEDKVSNTDVLIGDVKLFSTRKKQ